MSLDSLRKVYVEDLKDVYNAEQQLTKALPKMAKAATTPQLKQAFERHLVVTRTHIERLEQIFQKLEEKPTGKKCKGMEGLIEEGKEVIEEKGNEYATDAALIVAAQKVEHYEMAAYGSLRTFAQLLGEPQAARLLERTLTEEMKTDELLTKLAERNINQAAKVAVEESDENMASTGSGRGKASSSSRRRPARKSTASVAKRAGSATRSTRSATSTKSSRSSSNAKSTSRGNGSNGNITTDHEAIRNWVEERGGHPACVKGTGSRGDTGLLRIDYPGYSGVDTLQEISWDDFFSKFDEEGLAFVHQDKTSGGKKSRFSKLISRNSR